LERSSLPYSKGAGSYVITNSHIHFQSGEEDMPFYFLFLYLLYCSGRFCVLAAPTSTKASTFSNPYEGENDVHVRNAIDELGDKFGLDPHKKEEIPHELLAKIQAGAESGNMDNTYFLGLLKLYGISLKKQPEAAAKHFLTAAQGGLLDAMTAYGIMLYDGYGVEKNGEMAMKWFKMATSGGDKNALWLVGKLLIEGTGTPGKVPDFSSAASYFSKAAEHNIPQAEHHLGLMYEYGMGIEMDFFKAAEYYRRAAEKHYVESKYNLALMHAYGRGLQQNFERAYPLFEACAVVGHGPSAYMIGVFKTYGHGMPINYPQAIAWFERAWATGDVRIEDQAKEV
jgi:TPR repeat protein